LGIFGKEGGGTGSPEELLESVLRIVDELLAFEVPDAEARFRLT